LDAKPTPHFNRHLTLFDAIGVVVCAMIGSGIFIVSSQAAADLQSGSLLLVAWLVSGVMTAIGAFCFAELAADSPEVGGQYVYIKNAWGKFPSFLYGWTLSFVIKSGSIAAVALGFCKFLSILLPQINGFNLQAGALVISSQKLIAIFLILGLTLINSWSVKIVARIQNVVSVTNWLALILIILVGVFASFHTSQFIQNISLVSAFNAWDLQSVLTMGIALVGPLFAMEGWNNVACIAAEIKRPEKNLPLALVWGTGLTTLLYILVNGVYLSGLTLSEIIHAPNGVVGTAFMRSVIGPYGEEFIAVIIMIAAFGCVNSMILSGSRALYALAQDQPLLKRISQLGKNSHVPETALWIQAGWSIFLVLSRAFSDLLDYMAFTTLLFYALAVAGLFVLRKRDKTNTKQIYRIWGYPALPILYCVLCTWVMFSLLYLKPISVGISIGVLLSGWLLYLGTTKRITAPTEYQDTLGASTAMK